MTAVWEERIAEGARAMRSSAIRDLLKLTEQPDMISFAGGLPAPEMFPAEEISDYLERALAEEPVAALQYGPTEGHRPLRELLTVRMAVLGITVPTEQVLVTAGSQQALDLIGRLLIDPGAPVAVESPTYMGALQAWQTLRPHYLTLPIDDDGLQIDALEALLMRGERPRFLYVVSCFQNPTGVTLSAERRRALVELAVRYDLLIVEDDPYGELYYEGSRTQPLAAIDCAMHGSPRQVVYLSTFSKTLTPGLRVGWLSGPPEITTRLALLKQGFDLHTGSLAQIAATRACDDGLLERHVPRLREIYGERRNLMLHTLEELMPAGVRWTRPTGGMFVWLELPAGVNATQLLTKAITRRVAFVPGAPFFPNGGGESTMRLNFSHPSPERIQLGVQRLAAALADV
ncbi:MAG: PLP-dependent aminotransferase family protein [Oscillochloris sp.]|nr:PLP-dependent aminotransferase family protein [Oscillochloris sp.]